MGGRAGGVGVVASERVVSHRVLSPFFTGPLRAPERLQNTYAHECFIDEVAAQVQADPVAYRLRHIRDPRLIEIVKSPANGITYDCGVTRELGEDPVAVAEYFGSRRRINHVHYRNVQVVKPYEKYQEVFVDNGQVDMFGVMKALVRNRYNGTIYPEHPRALDADRDRAGAGGRIAGYPGGGGYAGFVYTVAYTRAMLQAALSG